VPKRFCLIRSETLNYVLFAAAGLFGAVTVAFYFLSGNWETVSSGWLAPLAHRFGQFRAALRILRSPSMAAAVLMTIPVWTADGTSVWFVLKAVHVSLTLRQLLMTLGIVSLSTLLPTAPGFIGTYQLAFVIAATSFGFSKAAGFAAATTSQLFILGTHCVIGVALMLIYHVGLGSMLFRKPAAAGLADD